MALGLGALVLVLVQALRESADPFARLGREAAAPASGVLDSGVRRESTVAALVGDGGARRAIGREVALAPFESPQIGAELPVMPAETAIAVRFMDQGTNGPMRGERVLLYEGYFPAQHLLGAATTDANGCLFVDPAGRPTIAAFELLHRLGEPDRFRSRGRGLTAAQMRLELGEAKTRPWLGSGSAPEVA